MANTYTSLHYHVIFSTKNREKYISHKIEGRVWAYIGGIARAHKMTALEIGGVEDHIHALVTAPATLSPSQIAQFLKGDSSKWIHEEFPALRDFAWQDGYGGFTVSKSNLPEVVRYIKISASIIEREHFKRNTWNSWRDTALNMTNVLCGDESIVANATRCQGTDGSRP